MNRMTLSVGAAVMLFTAGSLRADFIAATTLLGENERPVPHLGLPSAGTAVVHYDSTLDVLNVTIVFSDLNAPATAAHIHFGDPTIAGPVVVNFPAFPAATDGTFIATLTVADFIPRPAVGVNTFADVINGIIAGNTYVNIHNATFPGGEIRGQLHVIPEPATIALFGLGALGSGWALRRRKQ